MTHIIEDAKLDFQDVLLVPKRSTLDSRSKVDVLRTFKFKHSPESYTGMPIIVANMDHPGTYEMALALKPYGMSVALHKFYTVESLIKYFTNPDRNPHTFYSMGISDSDYEKYKVVSQELTNIGATLSYLCVDVANGYSRKFVKFVEKLRSETTSVIMAGNVVTPDAVYDLIERGVDIVKVGIGPGSVCTTRRLTGVGFPQLSAILECQDAAHQVDGLICGDGGIVHPGDFSKAFAAGSDFVMAGSVFAGHAECSGSLDNGGKMRFYGMSSGAAMDKHYGGKAAYRASEGKVVEIPFKGNVNHTAEEILGGIRSACTYIGARRLKDMAKCATFVRVNRVLNDSLNQWNV